MGALGASVLALAVRCWRRTCNDAPMAQPSGVHATRGNFKQKPPQTVLQQAHAAPDSRANQFCRAPRAPAGTPAAAGGAGAPSGAGVRQLRPCRIGAGAGAAAPAAGLGAVAGGVLGGVLGNQVGRAHRTAATVLGAVAATMWGHKVEERAAAAPFYQMRVRMRTALRNFTRAQPVAEGTPVRLEGKGFRVDDGASATDRSGARPVYVNDRAY